MATDQINPVTPRSERDFVSFLTTKKGHFRFINIFFNPLKIRIMISLTVRYSSIGDAVRLDTCIGYAGSLARADMKSILRLLMLSSSISTS